MHLVGACLTYGEECYTSLPQFLVTKSRLLEVGRRLVTNAAKPGWRKKWLNLFPGCSLQSFGAKSSSLSCTDVAVIYATIINAILSPNVTDGLHE